MPLLITDGTEYVDLLSDTSGFHLVEWTPAVPELKGGGVFADPVLADGRQMVMSNYANVVDVFTLTANGFSMDAVIRDTQIMRRLLQKALDYTRSKWQTAPVWIEARGKGETNTRYATIWFYQAPQDDNPFMPPFASITDIAAMEDFTLTLEHDIWQHVAPGTGECVQVSAQQNAYTEALLSFSPTLSADDGFVDTTTLNIDLASVSFSFGDSAGHTLHAGMRFRGVTIPQGAVILRAFVTGYAHADSAADECNISIKGEDVDSAAVFSTYANFMGRTRTTAAVAWDRVEHFVANTAYNTPEIKTIIQEIVDRPGWASGADLVIFLENNASDNGVYRNFSSWDHLANPAPALWIEYQTGTAAFGRAATCLDEVFVANKHGYAQLTHVFHYDASTATYSANLIGAALPVAFYPAVPAVGDIVYFGISSASANAAPFTSIVFDIGTAQTDLTTIVWEYWNGGAWAVLSTADGTTTSGITPSFIFTGVRAINWQAPAAWSTSASAVNTVSGWWVRARITAIGAGPVPPTQQNRNFYTVVVPFVDVDALQVKGDIPALARTVVAHFMRNVLASLTSVNRVICGLRSISRGADFTANINMVNGADPNNADISVSIAGATTSFSTDVTSPTNQCVLFNPAGADWGSIGIVFADDAGNQYTGTFHAYLRVKQIGGASGDMSVYLYTSTTGTIFTSETAYTANVGSVELLDLGLVSFPGSNIPAGYSWQTPSIGLYMANTAVAPGDLYVYDLILIPVDEWVGQYSSQAADGVGKLGTDEALNIDPLSIPKDRRLAFSYIISTSDVEERWGAVASGYPILQANADQRLWFLFQNLLSSETAEFPDPAIIMKVQEYRADRYLSMRGDR